MKEYDVVIIGSGTAGQTAAADLAGEDLRVALVESSDTPGGVCALQGCQAKKWFYEAMEVAARSHHLRDKGITTAPTTDWRQILREKNSFTEKIPQGTINSLRGMDVDYIQGQAVFTDERTLTVDGTPISVRNVVIATGARPRELTLAGSEHTRTSADFLGLEKLPERIVFIGGGFISFEFAHFAARLGSRRGEIHILEAGRPLGPFDNEMVALLVEASEDEGIRLHTDVTVAAVRKNGSGYRVELESGEYIDTDLVVNGTGRVPHIEDLGLDAAGVVFSSHGIEVDASMRTSNAHIFAVGDCAATIKLARVADFEAKTAAGAILAAMAGAPPPSIDYSAVPAVLFTYPQLGMVGKTEEQLQKENIRYRKSADSHLRWPTYRRVGMKHAAYKILVDEDDRLLGAHVLADNTTGLINTFKQALIDSVPISKLRDDNIMAPYPSRESDILYMLGPLLE